MPNTLFVNFRIIFLMTLGIFSILYYTYVFKKGKMRVNKIIYGYKFLFKDENPSRFLLFVIIGYLVGIICIAFSIFFIMLL